MATMVGDVQYSQVVGHLPTPVPPWNEISRTKKPGISDFFRCMVFWEDADWIHGYYGEEKIFDFMRCHWKNEIYHFNELSNFRSLSQSHIVGVDTLS